MNLSGVKSLRVVLVTSALFGGGSERTLLTMAEFLSGALAEVVIVTLRPDDLGPGQTAPAGIRLVRLGLIGEKNPLWRPRQLGQLLKLRKTLRGLNPSVVISFIDKLNVAVILSLVGTGIPVVATEHLAPWMNPLGAGWELLRKLAYRQATAVVSPTPAITDWFRQHRRGNFVTLPYPVDIQVGEKQGSVLRRKVIMGVGRLAPQKGFDLLIRAFAGIEKKWPDWCVEIAGEGPSRGELQAQIDEAGLQGRVTLLGRVTDVAQRLSSVEVFVLSSRHEAFPMVVGEALAAGCCVVATDCPTGPREMLELVGAPSGLLVLPENASKLSEGMVEVMADAGKRERMRTLALAGAGRLGPMFVMPKWIAWLNEMTAVSGR